MTSDFLNWIMTISTAFAGTGAALWFISRLTLSDRSNTVPQDTHALQVSTLLYRDGTLIDMENCGALSDRNVADTWCALRVWLAPRFPDLPEDYATLETPMTAQANDDEKTRLHLRPSPDHLQVTLSTSRPVDPTELHESALRTRESAALSSMTMQCPYPVWHLDKAGDVTWRNDASTTFFNRGGAQHTLALPKPGQTAIERIMLNLPGDASNIWFEVRTLAQEDGFHCYATEITDAVHAESARSEFIQTLTKTFATLPIGLAVFDHTRKLVLFNPALTDLTRLPVDVLSVMPDLMSFFDHLRDRQVMPEPRDYGTWRHQIQDILNSAENGLYQETWALPFNITYRVTGRPHPDGAVAFLFEDISADIVLSQRFQSELARRDAMIETMDEAVMMLAPDDTISFSNAAFRKMFAVDPDSRAVEIRLEDALRMGQARFPHTEFWSDLRQMIRSGDRQGHIFHQTNSPSAGPLSARFLRLPDGTRLVIVTHVNQNSPTEPA